MVFAATNCGTLHGVTGSETLQKTKKQTERAGTCPLFPLCAALFQQLIISRVQRVAYSAQLHGLYVLYAALDFDKALARHVHALKLHHAHKLRLPNAAGKAYRAYVCTDIDLVLLYFLHAAPIFYRNIIEKIAPPGKAEPPVHRSQKYTKNFCKNAEKSA